MEIRLKLEKEIRGKVIKTQYLILNIYHIKIRFLNVMQK